MTPYGDDDNERDRIEERGQNLASSSSASLTTSNSWRREGERSDRSSYVDKYPIIHALIGNSVICIANAEFINAQNAKSPPGGPPKKAPQPFKLDSFQGMSRLEICQKIYRTEDFRVKNLHRKRVIFDIC